MFRRFPTQVQGMLEWVTAANPTQATRQTRARTPESWTLVCAGFVEGSHPQAQAACDHLAGMTEPFAPLADDLVCTEQYGGDQTARITGRWAGEPVELELSRVNGCHISKWDALGPVLPIPVGVTDPLG